MGVLVCGGGACKYFEGSDPLPTGVIVFTVTCRAMVNDYSNNVLFCVGDLLTPG